MQMTGTRQQRLGQCPQAGSNFNDLFAWFEGGGIGHVAAWLAARDLSTFDPKAQVARTAGWGAVAASWGEPEDAVAWALDKLGNPDVVLGQELVNPQFDHHEEVAGMLKSPRKIAHRMNRAGYVNVPPAVADRWVFKREGRTLRSRYAFVKASSASDLDKARELIRAHAEVLLDRAESDAAPQKF